MDRNEIIVQLHIMIIPLLVLQVAGHPRNNLMTESTFLTVERLEDDEVWLPIATDADWETKYVYYHIFIVKLFSYNNYYY